MTPRNSPSVPLRGSSPSVPLRGNPLPPYPNGWYSIGFSDELRPGGLISRPIAGQDLVVFRTLSGKVCAADPYCPHLGAHLGHGGKVEGEVLRCPFHGFCYDGEGQCVATGYGTPPSPQAKLKTWPLREIGGALLVHYDSEGRAPTWEVPEPDSKDWGPMLHREHRLYDHPQEITENSVDMGHFHWVHGYKSVELLGDTVIDGPYFNIGYSARRPFFGQGRLAGLGSIDVQYDIHIYGLGYSRVEVTVPVLNFRARLLVLSTPINEEQTDLRFSIALHKSGAGVKSSPLYRLPGGLVLPLLTRLGLWFVTKDTSQDFDIWQNKRYLVTPLLAKGDGPIMAYRRWAEQFYPKPTLSARGTSVEMV
jgi:nitrite reductase/ring-hydroxylating ferredoxin subunit